MQALQAIDDQVPAEVLAVDAAVCRVAEVPDSFEYSGKLDAAILEPYRLTYYWDTARHGRAIAPRLLAAFFDGAERIGAVAPPELAAAPLDDPSVRQLVIGVDARRDPMATRVKLYVIFRQGARPVVEALADLCGAPALPAGANLDLTYIAGLDFGRGGLIDMKLYFALDVRAAHRLLRPPAGLTPLLGLSRMLVFQQGLVDPSKRALFFHAGDRFALRRQLAGFLGPDRPMSRLLTRARAMGDIIGTALDPWILSFPLVGGALDRQPCNVYFHLRD